MLHEKFFLVSSGLTSDFSPTSYRVPVSTIRKTVVGLEQSGLPNGKILARVMHTLILQISVLLSEQERQQLIPGSVEDLCLLSNPCSQCLLPDVSILSLRQSTSTLGSQNRKQKSWLPSARATAHSPHSLLAYNNYQKNLKKREIRELIKNSNLVMVERGSGICILSNSQARLEFTN